MNVRALACIAVVAAAPADAQDVDIDLIPGHAIHHESEGEAGVAMALSIGPAPEQIELCEELRLAAGLGHESGAKLRLETVFVVPYKAMAVEGLYLPSDGTSGSNALLRGRDITRSILDSIVSRAGIPPRVLDETDVEHEISCSPHEPVWSIAWTDVRRIGDDQPEAVIERARRRFLEIHESVVEYKPADGHLQQAQRPARDG
jgi:hypothetical protein